MAIYRIHIPISGADDPPPLPDAPGEQAAPETSAAAPLPPEQTAESADGKTCLLDTFARTETAFRDINRQFEALQAQQLRMLDSMVSIAQHLPGIAEELPKLQEAIDGVRWDKGLERLCRLHREMALRRNPDEALDDASRALARILTQDFGLEIICPVRGEPFDAERHMRVRADMPSEGRVRRCVAVGWTLRGQALLRALVETMHRGMEGGGF